MTTLVHREPMMCSLVGNVLAQATGTPVTVQCQRERTVVWGFSKGRQRRDETEE